MMGVDALLKEVEERRAKALEALEAEYAAKTDEVKKRTTEQVAYVTESANKEAATQAQKESTRVEGAAKLQAKKAVFDATERLLENNVSLLRQELADLAVSPAYKDLLGRMAQYATKRLGGKISVVCRKADEATLKAAGARITSADLNAMGGFKAENAEGTLELDLTFEEILRGRGDEVRAAILGKE
ncbi:MAG TPA: V-type ATP synthase subunit E [Nitrososphaerales archaeon]|nr:V-type ATP synthase subunit E [Nitrososphaerales archaeon]HUK75124.1 V-type ATP synthase subunit E [Nitrososphaerales archaeon]